MLDRARTERVFYDGHCGLCHGAVRFVLARDRTGNAFRFTPLDSELFRTTVPEAQRVKLGETLVVQTSAGAILARSRAVIHIMRRLGSVWRLLAELLWLIPAPIRDRLYDAVAWSRRRLFRPPVDACPVVPPNLRQRFDF